MSSRSFKVVLLGEGRVGKSSIILRFMHNKYDDRQQSTLSASCFDKSMNLGGAETARISLWDTAGQERFHALGPLYYRDAGALLLRLARPRPALRRPRREPARARPLTARPSPPPASLLPSHPPRRRAASVRHHRRTELSQGTGLGEGVEKNAGGGHCHCNCG